MRLRIQLIQGELMLLLNILLILIFLVLLFIKLALLFLAIVLHNFHALLLIDNLDVLLARRLTPHAVGQPLPAIARRCGLIVTSLLIVVFVVLLIPRREPFHGLDVVRLTAELVVLLQILLVVMLMEL